MKRKRGSKKGPKKGKRKEPAEQNDTASAAISIDAEDDDCLDQNVDSRHDSEMDTEPPAAVADKPGTISSFESDQTNDNSIGKPGPARLKVKLRSSKALEPHRSYSDLQTPSDTDKSNQQAAFELNNTAVEREDSTFSDGQTSEMQINISEKIPKKPGSIRIKSSSLVLSNEDILDKNLNRPNNPSPVPSERELVISDDEKSLDLMLPKKLQKVETKQSYRDVHRNAKELSAALTVIKKVMKMDAAEPFNAPVDPVALGIPDYFDIIDTPMDFGTICHDLERGSKYMNSEDVFKDVQLIWHNCYKYNNKGDYIVDLMKRVKKNFMKYWMAAGLYLDKPSNGAAERTHVDDGTRPSQDKFYPKGKQKYKRRRHGIDLHKSDCLCAVCVVRRRRKEREKGLSAIERQMNISNAEIPREISVEGSSAINQECSEDATSSQDDHSHEGDANADYEEVENEEKTATPELTDPGESVKQDAMDEMEPLPHTSGSRGVSLHLPPDNGAREDSPVQDLDLGFGTETGDHKDVMKVQQEDPKEERTDEGSAEGNQPHIAMQENPLLVENHSVLQICRNLFPNKTKSIWNGPHSLMRSHVPSTRDTPIHSAVAAFVKSFSHC